MRAVAASRKELPRNAGHILRLRMLRAVNHLVDTRKWDDIAWLELVSHAASTLRQHQEYAHDGMHPG